MQRADCEESLSAGFTFGDTDGMNVNGESPVHGYPGIPA
jgi:hypothetical protein